MPNERKSDKLGRCLRCFRKGGTRMDPHSHAPEGIRNSLGTYLFGGQANETLSQMYLNGPFWGLYWHLHDSIKEENHAQ